MPGGAQIESSALRRRGGAIIASIFPESHYFAICQPTAGYATNGRMCANERGALVASCALGHAMGAEPLHERGHLCWVGRVLGIDH